MIAAGSKGVDLPPGSIALTYVTYTMCGVLAVHRTSIGVDRRGAGTSAY